MVKALHLLFYVVCLLGAAACDDVSETRTNPVVEPDSGLDAEAPRNFDIGGSTGEMVVPGTGEAPGEQTMAPDSPSTLDVPEEEVGEAESETPEEVPQEPTETESAENTAQGGSAEDAAAQEDPATQPMDPPASQPMGMPAMGGMPASPPMNMPTMGGTPEPDPPLPSTVMATIIQPVEMDVFEATTPLTFVGQASDETTPAMDLAVRWTSDVDGELFMGAPNNDGGSTFSTTELSPGYHNITLEVSNPAGQSSSSSVRIGICTVSRPETFDTALDSDHWRTYGDAYWDDGGWLEMTGTSMGRKGAIYNVRDRVSPGDVAISFRIWTGGGTGADGFSMNVFDARSVAELDQIFTDAATGGGLGYGVGGDWGTWAVDAFHVEFDTWHNVFNGDNELHTDPTPENHVGVMTNGDPGTHHLWAEIPTIEGAQWHDVTIEVNGEHVVITLDGNTVIDGPVQGLRFKGGFIGFSGTTGHYTNYHRFDDLEILQECSVP